MKIKPILNYFWKAVFGLALVNGIMASETVAQNSTTFSKPGYSMNYDHNGTNWVHISNTTYTYNSNGDLTFGLSTDPISNQNLIKENVTHDAQGNERSHFVYKWQNNTWVLRNGQRDSLVYDNNNHITLRISQWLQNGAWEGEKFDNTYDANGNLTEEIRSMSSNGIWELVERTTITLVNGLITEKLHELHNGTNWRNYEKEVFASWHIPNVLPASYTYQGYNSATNQWRSPWRKTNTLTSNGGYVSLTERFQNNSWINDSRGTIYKDFRGNDIGNLTENYVNGAWVSGAENQILITYNNLYDITEQIHRWQNITGGQISGPVVDQYKEVYSNFQYFNRGTLGTKDTKDAKLEVAVYPNPTLDLINIGFEGNKPQPLTATVTDITGKTRKTQTFKSEEAKQLNIETLPKGVYLLQLKTEAGTITKRIVKQ